jgi:hypothetical protein
MKEYIKALVKESLGGLLREKSKTPKKDEKKDKSVNDKPLDQRDQVSVQIGADSEMAPPLSHIMQKAGLGNKNDAADRSKFNQKLYQKNGQGFTDNELSAVSTVINDLNL